MINNGFYKIEGKYVQCAGSKIKMFADSQSMACEGELPLICRSSSRPALLDVIDSKYDDL